MHSLPPRTTAHWATPNLPELCEALALTDESVQELKELLGFDLEHEQILKTVRSILTGRLDSIVDGSLARMSARERLRAPRLHSELSRASRVSYVDRLLAGPFDLDRALECVAAGIAQQQAGVEPRRYLAGAMDLFNAIVETVAPLLGPSDPPCLAVMAALSKVLAFDNAIVLETYTHTEHRMFEFFATHDSVTRLPNASGVWQHLERLVTAPSGSRQDLRVAVFLVGLSRFRTINETLGHRVGDDVLCTVGQRLRHQAEDNAMVGRISGDQFAVVREVRGESEWDVTTVGQRLIERLQDPISVGGFSISIDANVGIVVHPDHGHDAETLLKNAETALDVGKSLQNALTVYSPAHRQHTAEHLRLLGRLRAAIESGQLLLHYHPEIEVGGYLCTGAEALLRWRLPEGGLVPPGDFIPIAEQTTVIHPVTEWLIREACRQLAEWNERGERLTVSVNLAAANLQNAGLPGIVEEALQRWSVAPSQLICEITESGFLRQPQTAIETLQRLRALGIRLSLDDFGTGYSSLAYLRDLPIQEIKLDRSFVSRLRQSDTDRQIVAHVIQLAHVLGLTVVAEGIEDQGTADSLAALGCDRLQGFHFTRPLPASDLPGWIANFRAARLRV